DSLLRWYEFRKEGASDWVMEEDETEEQLKENLYKRIVYAGASPRSPKKWGQRLSLAASFLIICGIGWYWFDSKPAVPGSGEPAVIAENTDTTEDIRPGGVKAILTLGNGTK